MALPLLLSGLAAFASRTFLYSVLLRVLVGLGVAAISYVGFSALMDQAIAHIQAQLTALPVGVVEIVRLARVDDAISVVLSSITVRLTLMGLTSGGALRKITWGRQGELF